MCIFIFQASRVSEVLIRGRLVRGNDHHAWWQLQSHACGISGQQGTVCTTEMRGRTTACPSDLPGKEAVNHLIQTDVLDGGSAPGMWMLIQAESHGSHLPLKKVSKY